VSTQTDEPTIELQLAYPDGQLRLRAPSDIPLQELLAELLEVCEQPDSDDWTLSADGTNPYPTERSLDELGVSDGAHLVLAPHARTDGPAQPDLEAMHDALGGGSEGSERAATMELVPLEAAGLHTKLTGRPRVREPRQPLSDKTARTLPKRLSGPERIAETLRLIGTPEDQPARPVSTDTPGPAHFTRRARISPVARLRAAWLDTEYQYRLEDRILEMRLRRCATIAVLSPKGGVGKTTTTALIGSMLASPARSSTPSPRLIGTVTRCSVCRPPSLTSTSNSRVPSRIIAISAIPGHTSRVANEASGRGESAASQRQERLLCRPGPRLLLRIDCCAKG
jgi:hypothetical protein